MINIKLVLRTDFFVNDNFNEAMQNPLLKFR